MLVCFLATTTSVSPALLDLKETTQILDLELLSSAKLFISLGLIFRLTKNKGIALI